MDYTTLRPIVAYVAVALLGLCFRAEAAASSDESPVKDNNRSTALELIVLGSGGPGALGRAASSYLLVVDGAPRILVDAGPGSFARVGEAQVSLEQVDVVLLTHLHVDHAAELPGLIKARAVSSSSPINFHVFGPTGRPAHGDIPAFPSTSRFMSLMFGADGVFAYLKDFAVPITFEVRDLPAGGVGARHPMPIFTESDLVISAIGGHHGDAPAIVYRVDHGGRSIVFSGDIDARGLPALGTIAEGANLLVFDAVVLDPPGSRDVLYTLHTPPNAIGALADSSHVAKLLLSHLSPAVDRERSQVTESIASHYRGPVEFAADGMRVEP